MENIEQKPLRTNDEIDLIELFVRMWEGLKNSFFWILDQLKSLLILIIRKFIWILAFAIVGIGYSLFIHSLVKDYYFSEASFRSNGISNTHVIDFINQLDDLLANQNFDAVASRLGVDVDEVQDVKSIGAYYGIDINKDRVFDYADYEKAYDPLDTMMIRLPIMVYVKVELYNTNNFNVITKAVIDYVSKNSFIITNNNLRLRQVHERINSIELEIRKLDSLQKIQYFDVPRTQRASTNQMLVLNEKEMKLYHDVLLGLKSNKQLLEAELELYSDPITIMQPFTELKLEKDGLGLNIIFKGIFYGIIGFIVSLIWQYRKNLYSAIKTTEE